MTPRRWVLALGAAAAQRALGAPSAQSRALSATTQAPEADPVRRGRPLVFPRDHGAHPLSRIEWWYVTGWLVATPPAGIAEPDGAALDLARAVGFQVTFFRSRTGLGQGLASRFAPRQLLFAHAAVTEVGAGRHRHAERLARWSGEDDPALRSRARLGDADLRLGDWSMTRSDDAPGPAEAASDSRADPRPAQGQERWRVRVAAGDFALKLTMSLTQARLLQGDNGFSRKGPQPSQASHYYSDPQLRVEGQLQRSSGPWQDVRGRAWLDHEWSDELLHPQAVGWDWVGLNLFDGSALTAFALRRADGSVLWSGGSLRGPAQAVPRVFADGEVRLEPGRRWRSGVTGATYPVEWSVQAPGARLRVRAVLDAQEMDGRQTTGTAYWEGLCEVLDVQNRRVGLGYLEMTGYAGRLRL